MNSIAKIFLGLMIIAILHTALAQETEQQTRRSIKEIATGALIEQATQEIQKMQNNGFSAKRAYDTLAIAKQLYDLEVEKGQNGEKQDFIASEQEAMEAIKLTELAFETFDQLQITKSRVSQITNEKSKQEAEEIMANAEKEFKNERYEKTKELIEQANQKIAEAETLQTKANALYEAAKKTLENTIIANIQIIGLIAMAAIIALAVFWGDIKKAKLKAKLGKLENRKKIIQGLIAEAQKQYFQENKLPETLYKAREELYKQKEHELIRQVALAKEELALTKTLKEKLIRKQTKTDKSQI